MREPTPPFWKRMLLLPFSPRLIAQARHWSVGEVLMPLATLALLVGAALGLYRGIEFTRALKEVAATFDAKFDPIVIDRGVVRVEGTRLPRYDEKGTLYLVDPAETIPEERLPPNFVVARKSTIVERLEGNRRVIELGEGLAALGIDHLRLDSASINGWLERRGTLLLPGLVLALSTFELLGVLATVLFAVLGGLALGGLWGTARGITGHEGFRVALAALTLKPVLSVCLSLVGLGSLGCAGLIVWPLMAILYGSWAISRLPEQTG